MKKFFSALMLLLPLLTYAQAYKCKQSNGVVSYQYQPCADGAATSRMNLPVPSNEAVTMERPPQKEPRQITDQNYQGTPFDSKVREEAERASAFNKMQRCNFSRQQLGTLKMERPVYTTNNKGERIYVKDEERQGKVLSAQQRVYKECK